MVGARNHSVALTVVTGVAGAGAEVCGRLVGTGVRVGASVGRGVEVDVGVSVEVGVLVGRFGGVSVAVATVRCIGVGEAVGTIVGVTVRVAVAVGDGVRVGRSVAVGEGAFVSVGVDDGALVATAVALGVAVTTITFVVGVSVGKSGVGINAPTWGRASPIAKSGRPGPKNGPQSSAEHIRCTNINDPTPSTTPSVRPASSPSHHLSSSLILRMLSQIRGSWLPHRLPPFPQFLYRLIYRIVALFGNSILQTECR